MDESHRFRRALKNPLVVLGLCLMAGMAVYQNVVTVPSDASDSISGEENRLPPLSARPPAIGVRTHESEKVQWIDHPARDPFTPVAAAEAPLSESLATNASRSAMEYPQVQDELVLKAVAVDGQQRSAVINRTVLYEGEMINGYRILSIQPKGVWLKQEKRTRWLTFSENSAPSLVSN